MQTKQEDRQLFSFREILDFTNSHLILRRERDLILSVISGHANMTPHDLTHALVSKGTTENEYLHNLRLAKIFQFEMPKQTKPVPSYKYDLVVGNCPFCNYPKAEIFLDERDFSPGLECDRCAGLLETGD